MSILRSTQRLLEGVIGEVSVEPLIGYGITLQDLTILHPNLSSNILNLLPPIEMDIGLVGHVNVRGRNESGSNGESVYLNSFITQEVMRFWALPKKVSIALYEDEMKDVYIIRPRVINNYLVVEEVKPIDIDYCKNTYSLGLGEMDETLSNKYWNCSYIDRIRVYGKYGLDEGWVEWVSY